MIESDEPSDFMVLQRFHARYREQLVYGVALKLVGNVHDAEDVVQAVGVICGANSSFAYISDAATWGYLVRVTYNEALRLLGRRNQREHTVDDEFVLQQPSPDDDAFDAAERSKQVNEVIETFDHDDQMIIRSRMNGVTFAKLSKTIGLSESAIKSRWLRMQDDLKLKLEALVIE